MDRAALKNMLKDVLERSVGDPVSSIEEGMTLKEDLGLDSIDLATMAIEVQSECDIELKTEELKGVVLVADLLDLLQKKLGSQQKHAA